MTYNICWFPATSINSSHSHLPVTQVYGWLYTTDKKIILVSKDNVSWQFPGGHPIPNESLLDTLSREIYEETNQLVQSSSAKFFGYYVVEEVGGSGLVLRQYLQIRYFVPIPTTSIQLDLRTNERLEDTDTVHMKTVQAFTLTECLSLINWLAKSDELQTARQYLN